MTYGVFLCMLHLCD